MDKVKEIAECCICAELFIDPRMLPCNHSFCLECLIEMSTKLAQVDFMPCPLCRATFVIPKDGLASLRINSFMSRLVEMVKMSKETIYCEICLGEINEEGADIPEASHYCNECGKNICVRCCRDHRRFQELKEHTITSLEVPEKGDATEVDIDLCDNHKGKKLEIYCVDCKKVSCLMCFAEEHTTHNCSDIEEVKESFSSEIARVYWELKGFSEASKMRIQNIAEQQMKLRTRVETVEEDIIRRGNELKEFVDRSTQFLLAELDSIREQSLTKLDDLKEESECHHATIESLEIFCARLIYSKSSAEIVRRVSDVRSQRFVLHENHTQRMSQDIPATDVSFEPSSLEYWTKATNCIGTINVSTLSDSLLNMTDFSLECGYGVTKLENKIYVLAGMPYSILVFFDEHPYNFQHKFEAREVKTPVDLGSSDKSKRIYMSDAGNCCIWWMAANDHRISKWLSGLYWPYTFSISNEDLMLVLIESKPYNRLQIYDLYANLLRSIELPISIQKSVHCIQKPNGEFLVAHKAGTRWAISLLSNAGQILASQSQIIDDSGKRNIYPEYLSVDSNSNQIIVAEFFNHRVTAFDLDSLRFRQILSANKDDEMLRPFRLHFDSKESQLIIVQSNGQVTVMQCG